jgi:hypothetical protein
MSYAVTGMSAEIVNAAAPRALDHRRRVDGRLAGQLSGTWFSGITELGSLERNTTPTASTGTPSAGSGGQSFGSTPGVASRAAALMSSVDTAARDGDLGG